MLRHRVAALALAALAQSVSAADTSPVVVTVTLRSWGDAQATVSPACEDGGFMRGVTPDVLYLLRLRK